MTEEEVDTLMSRILLDSLKLEWSNYLESTAPIKTSKQYIRQMQKMLADPLAWCRNKSRPVWKKVLHKAASFLIVITITFGTLMTTSPTARAAVLQWIIEWYGVHVSYQHLDETLETEMPQYEITSLPEGYVEEERNEFFGYITVTYKNADDNFIYLDYYYIQKGVEVIISVEDVITSDIIVNGYYGQLFISEILEQTNAITWIASDVNIQFTIDGFLDEVELVNIAKNISLIDEN